MTTRKRVHTSATTVCGVPNHLRTEDNGVPPLRDLAISRHEPRVDIRLFRQGPAALDPDLLAEVQEGVHDRRRDARKGQPVRHRERRGQEQRRVALVLLQVERRLGRENPGYVVLHAGVVVADARRDGHERGVPRVREVEDRGEHPEEPHEAGGDVRGRPPRGREGRADVRDLGPVEGDEGHAQAREVSEQLVDDEVVGRNPADPVEVAEGLEDVAREEVPEERAGERIDEETFTGDTPMSSNTSVLLGVEGVEQRAIDQIHWPNHGWGRNKEATGDPTDRKPNLTRRKRGQTNPFHGKRELTSCVDMTSIH